MIGLRTASHPRMALVVLAVAVSALVSAAPALAADDIPGDPISASPVSGSTSQTEERDVYSVPLLADQLLELTLTGSAAADYDLYVWSPDATSVVEIGQSLPVAWSNGDATSNESISYLVPPGGSGTYYVEVHSFNIAAGTYQLTWNRTTPSVARLFGANRYETSNAISRSSFVKSDSVVIATGSNYPDALAASGLAGVLDCPVVLIRGNSIASDEYFELIFEMQRLGCTNAYIVGGTGVISQQVEDDLSVSYDVERLAGLDRYGTARAVADKMVALGADPASAFVVSGANFADALAVSPYAFSQKIPVLLTRPAALPASVSGFITDNGINDIVVAGGTGAVSSAVAGALDGLNGGAASVYRAGGPDRYATAALVARYCVDTRGWGTWDYVGVATGALFPDALSGGAAVGTRNGALLLTRPDALVSATSSAIDDHDSVIDLSLVFGGTGAVSDSVKSAIAAAMQ